MARPLVYGSQTGQRGRWTRRGGVSTVPRMAKPGAPEYQAKVAELVASAPPPAHSRRESIERITAHATIDGKSAGPVE
jgi:hypothetical protein